MTRQNHGCCVDESCTPDTCMELPEGETCFWCADMERCVTLFNCKPDSTSCDWFPRRFRAVEPPATKGEVER